VATALHRMGRILKMGSLVFISGEDLMSGR
jgi:hypothetical protein